MSYTREYEPSPEAKKLIDSYLKWKDLSNLRKLSNDKLREFQRDMDLLQSELIRLHWNDMDEITQARAVKTLADLDARHG